MKGAFVKGDRSRPSVFWARALSTVTILQTVFMLLILKQISLCRSQSREHGEHVEMPVGLDALESA